MKESKFKKLYIIGNGFDLMHKMSTRYEDFYNWLIYSGRHNVIEELQSIYNIKKNGTFLLWSDFEKALGKYDVDIALNWRTENLYITEPLIEDPEFTDSPIYLNTQLNDIINDVFPQWFKQIKIATEREVELPQDALYFTFNYTDTLEQLYGIPQENVIHIHGRSKTCDKLIVGHINYRESSDYWDDNIDLRENNERIQRISDMNELCKPIDLIIAAHKDYFDAMRTINHIEVIGHSCSEIDYLYYKQIQNSIAKDAKWVFNPYKKEDVIRVKELEKDLQLQHFYMVIQ